MTLRLRNHLAEIFNSQIKTTKKIQSSPRAMAKLLKEAERVKLVLSANADHTAQVSLLNNNCILKCFFYFKVKSMKEFCFKNLS